MMSKTKAPKPLRVKSRGHEVTLSFSLNGRPYLAVQAEESRTMIGTPLQRRQIAAMLKWLVKAVAAMPLPGVPKDGG